LAKPAEKKRRRKIPRSAAVVLTCLAGKYTEAMTTVRGAISLAELGIEEIRPKRALTGALLLELPGAKADAADCLASCMREALAGMEGVRVTRPLKCVDLRVRDLTTRSPRMIYPGRWPGSGAEEVKVGDVRPYPNKLGGVWVRCPVAAASKIAQRDRIPIGFLARRVELLDDRPLLCYRCLERGHVQQHCSSGADRSGRCYRCGDPATGPETVWHRRGARSVQTWGAWRATGWAGRRARRLKNPVEGGGERGI